VSQHVMEVLASVASLVIIAAGLMFVAAVAITLWFVGWTLKVVRQAAKKSEDDQ